MQERAARFHRVSSEGQRYNTSLENQLDNINAYCVAHGYAISDDTLFTEVMTGVEIWEMPVLQQMLAKAEQGIFDLIVVDHTDRMVRGEILVAVLSHLARFGIRVESVKQKIEDTPEGKLVLLVSSWGSKREWDRIKQRTREGRENFVYKQHKILGTNSAYGYTKIEGKYVYNDDIILTDTNGVEWSERSVVSWIFQKAKEGLTLKKIAHALTDMGIPTRRDGKWNKYPIIQILEEEGYSRQREDPENQELITRIKTLFAEGMKPTEIARLLNAEGIAQTIIPQVWRASTISLMLGNPTYMGNFYALRKTYKHTAEGWTATEKPREEQVLLTDAAPPIIDEETFLIVQRQLDYNKETSLRNTKHPDVGLLRGRCRCAYCGSRMNVRDRETHSYYFCIAANQRYGKCSPSNTIGLGVVDRGVWEFVCEIIRDPTKLKESIKALRTPDPTTEKGQPIVERKKELETEIANLVDMGRTAKNKQALEKIQGWMKKAEEGLEEIEEKEKILEAIRKYWAQAQVEIKRFETWCSQWVDKLEDASFADKLTCVIYLGIEVTVYRFGSFPRFTIDVSPPDLLENLLSLEKKSTFVSIRSCLAGNKRLFFLRKEVGA